MKILFSVDHYDEMRVFTIPSGFEGKSIRVVEDPTMLEATYVPQDIHPALGGLRMETLDDLMEELQLRIKLLRENTTDGTHLHVLETMSELQDAVDLIYMERIGG